MKLILQLILTIAITFSLTAQVAIGKSTVNGDGILDFQDSPSKGILLPRVLTPDAGSVPGTLLFNVNTLKVEYLDNAGWQDLSIEEGEFVQDADYLKYEEEQPVNGVIIGATSSPAPGVLVLESTAKALILPKMDNPHLVIKDPEAGMIAYDKVSKTLFVFNGLKWTIWGKE